MEKKIPRTKEECFEQLDAELSEEDKVLLSEDEELDTHFSLGLWIRNNWIYQSRDGEIMQLLDSFGLEPIPFHPDSFSSDIIKAYREYLRNKNQ